MRVSRPDFPSPVIIIDEFLPGQSSERILLGCIALQDFFAPAAINDKRYGLRMDTNFRSNQVLYLGDSKDDTGAGAELLEIIRHRIWSEECKRLWHDGEYLFDIINFSNWHSGTISRYGAGDFYKRHRDTAWNHITSRLVTFVYYVNREPVPFTGGNLVLNKSGCELDVAPRHNRAVVFPSFTIHEVLPVQTDGPNWGDGRFSLNFWIGFR